MELTHRAQEMVFAPKNAIAMNGRFPFSSWPLGPEGYSRLSGLPLGGSLLPPSPTPRMPWDLPASVPPRSSPPFGSARGLLSGTDQPKAAGHSRELDFFGPPPHPAFFGLSSPDTQPPAINTPSLFDLYVAMLPPLVAPSPPNDSSTPASLLPRQGLDRDWSSGKATTGVTGSPPLAPQQTPAWQDDSSESKHSPRTPAGETMPLEMRTASVRTRTLPGMPLPGSPVPGAPFPLPPGPSPLQWLDLMRGFWQGLINEYRSKGRAGGRRGDDDDYCYERHQREDSRCRERTDYAHPDFKNGCLERAAARRNMCVQNGGRPDPNEPPEWGPDDEDIWFNTGR